MTAVQDHGFGHEDRIIKAKTGLSKKELNAGYTSIHDIPAGIYTAPDGTVTEVKNNTSIKTTKNKSICCGDINRFFKETTKDEDLEVVISQYKQSSKTTKSFHTTYVFNINKKHKDILWSGITEDTIKDFDKYVKNIQPGKEAQLANKDVWKAERKNIYNTCGEGVVKIAAKIDSKTQRRTQCTFNIKKMIEAGVPYEVYTDEYAGIPVKYDYDSE